MTATYTLHVPPDAVPGDPDALDRAVLVREGFAWGAFLAPALWFLWHRHLVGCLIALVAVGGLAAGLTLAGANPGAIVAAELLLHLLFGLEGSSLRRVLLAARGRPARDIVIAADETGATARAFGRWLSDGRTEWERPRETPSNPRSAAGGRNGASSRRGSEEPIIGLFPEREARR